MDAWKFNANVDDPGSDDQFPGWPLIIDQEDNYNRRISTYLPALEFEGDVLPVIEVINDENGELVYTLRMKDKTFRPGVFKEGNYTIRAIQAGTGKTIHFSGLKTEKENTEKIKTSF